MWRKVRQNFFKWRLAGLDNTLLCDVTSRFSSHVEKSFLKVIKALLLLIIYPGTIILKGKISFATVGNENSFFLQAILLRPFQAFLYTVIRCKLNDVSTRKRKSFNKEKLSQTFPGTLFRPTSVSCYLEHRLAHTHRGTHPDCIQWNHKKGEKEKASGLSLFLLLTIPLKRARSIHTRTHTERIWRKSKIPARITFFSSLQAETDT